MERFKIPDNCLPSFDFTINGFPVKNSRTLLTGIILEDGTSPPSEFCFDCKSLQIFPKKVAAITFNKFEIKLKRDERSGKIYLTFIKSYPFDHDGVVSIYYHYTVIRWVRDHDSSLKVIVKEKFPTYGTTNKIGPSFPSWDGVYFPEYTPMSRIKFPSGFKYQNTTGEFFLTGILYRPNEVTKDLPSFKTVEELTLLGYKLEYDITRNELYLNMKLPTGTERKLSYQIVEWQDGNKPNELIAVVNQKPTGLYQNFSSL